MNEEYKKEDEIVDDDQVAKTVFFHAIKEGVDEDEAMRLAVRIGEIRYKSWHQRLKRWVLGRIEQIGILITAIITAIIASAGEHIIDAIKSMF